MSEAPKVHMFLSPRFVVQNFLNYVLQPTVYSYCLYFHKANALKGGLTQTLRQDHEKQKMNQKGKENFKMKEGV